MIDNGTKYNTMETNLLSTRGRLSRGAYWSWWLLVLVIDLVVGFFAGAAGAPGAASFVGLVMGVVLFIQGVKRMHDVGYSGWWMLVPVCNVFLSLAGGDPEENRYGAAPVRRE